MNNYEFWQAPCGCHKRYPKPNWRPWYWKPEWYWFGWKTLVPFGLGGDEFCRRTVTLGWNWLTGILIVPVWYCKGCEDCGPRNYDYIFDAPSEEWARERMREIDED